MNLIEKLGLEKCKAIVDGAPKWAVSVNLHNGMYYDLREVSRGDLWLMDLRTAIAKFECDHDWEDITCNGDLERQLICTYCSMKKSVPFELNAKQWTDEDTDHCTDIRITLAL